MKLDIARMGARGDGEADTLEGVVHVPFTLPGETVNAAVAGVRGTALSLLVTSAERAEPVCQHFEACGGCTLQHWQLQPILEWKRQLLAEALAMRGINASVAPAIACAAGERRRVTLSVRSEQGRVVTGSMPPIRTTSLKLLSVRLPLLHWSGRFPTCASLPC